MADTESIGSIISRAKVPGAKKKRQALDLIVANWEHIAGARIAAHCEPSRLARGTLTVRADSPAWAAEASVQSAVLLRKIEAMLPGGVVGKVKVRAGEAVPEPDEPGEAGVSAEEKPPEGELAVEISSIEDEEMRRALARLARSSGVSKQTKHKGPEGARDGAEDKE